jgi:hypothetical protein
MGKTNVDILFYPVLRFVLSTNQMGDEMQNVEANEVTTLYESGTIGKHLFYQRSSDVGHRRIVERAVQQNDGSWYFYLFYLGGPPGHPIRSKARQAGILAFIKEVKNGLNG